MSVLDAALRLREAVAPYPARAPLGAAAYVLNPLDYAWPLHRAYIERFAPAGHRVEAVLLGMNPGPWGMAQTGVPFGAVPHVRDFLGLRGEVVPPARTHPKRPIHGLACARVEVSGSRLWGAIHDAFGAPEPFFARFYVANYCPLVFQTETGANLVPEKVPAEWMTPVEAACARHLREVVAALRPRTVIGVGQWAAKQAAAALGDEVAIASILHPSPASPAANRGWAEQARAQLADLGHPWP